jgi:hypothetical protein
MLRLSPLFAKYRKSRYPSTSTRPPPSARQRPAAARGRGARLEAFLPRAAELLRKTVKRGLDGDPAEAAEARMTLRSRLLLGGKIKIGPDERGIVADFTLTPGVC